MRHCTGGRHERQHELACWCRSPIRPLRLEQKRRSLQGSWRDEDTTEVQQGGHFVPSCCDHRESMLPNSTMTVFREIMGDVTLCTALSGLGTGVSLYPGLRSACPGLRDITPSGWGTSPSGMRVWIMVIIRFRSSALSARGSPLIYASVRYCRQ